MGFIGSQKALRLCMGMPYSTALTVLTAANATACGMLWAVPLCSRHGTVEQDTPVQSLVVVPTLAPGALTKRSL